MAENEKKENCTGNYGCHHELLHAAYQQFFGANCCSVGECRPTNFRQSEGSSGVEALVDGRWVRVPPAAIRDPSKLPLILRNYAGHVCASPPSMLGGEGAPPRIIIWCAVMVTFI